MTFLELFFSSLQNALLITASHRRRQDPYWGFLGLTLRLVTAPYAVKGIYKQQTFSPV